MNTMFRFAVLSTVLALGACKEFETELRVNPINAEGPQVLKMNSKERGAIELDAGTYFVKVKINDSARDPDEIEFLNSKGRSQDVRVKLQLPKADDFLHVLEPIELSPEQLGQPFSMVVMRDVDLDYDTIGISFRDPVTKDTLATMQIRHKGTKVAFDADNNEFLRSYQKVKYTQRGVLIPVDGDLDMDFWTGVADHVVNFSGAVFMAPWVYARYWHIEWALSNDASNREVMAKKWGNLLAKRPVVDYLAFTHGGADMGAAGAMEGHARKKNQIRLVYTEGCSSGSAYDFITNFNAAGAVGHSQTSASPFFAFPLVRGWTYGYSMLDSVNKGWRDGKITAFAIDLVTINSISKMGWGSHDDMIKSSEPMFSWTSELPPQKIFIGLSAVPERKSAEQREIFESSITTYDQNNASTQRAVGAQTPVLE